MTAFYNEIEPKAAAGLRKLIAGGHIAPGIVDERSIEEITPYELERYTQCHFFAGTGGWSLALRLAGWPDDRRVWTGSCPCQPFSKAGAGKGFADERHLWPEFQYLIGQCQPPSILGEQIAGATADRWINLIQHDLEQVGYAFGSASLTAISQGAPHARERNYWAARHIANAKRDEQSWQESCGRTSGRMGRQQQPFPWHEPWPCALSRLRVLGDGIPRSVAACDAARNAIVPQVAAAFIESYLDCIDEYESREAVPTPRYRYEGACYDAYRPRRRIAVPQARSRP